MGVLDKNLEPEVATISIKDRYCTEIKHSHDQEFENRVLNLKILEDKRYTPEELGDIIKECEPKAIVMVYGDEICVQRRYLLRRNAYMNTKILIYPKLSTTHKLFYMDYESAGF